MKVLVTGGNGFIGKHVCTELSAKGHEPIVFDRRPGSHDAMFLGDIRDKTAVWQGVGETDATIHLGGLLGTAEMVDNPVPAIETNILGSMNVFQAIREFDRPAVYITLGNYWMNNTYSITKSTSERFALMANKEWGTRIAVVRGYHAFGPGQKTAPVKKIVPSFVMSALRDEPVFVYGEGDQIADMIYVEDLATILVQALLVDHGIYDSIFEAGTGVPTTVNEVAQACIDETEAPSSFIAHVPMRPGEPEGAVVLGDPTTLEPLGITPSHLTSLKNGLKPTVRYYREMV